MKKKYSAKLYSCFACRMLFGSPGNPLPIYLRLTHRIVHVTLEYNQHRTIHVLTQLPINVVTHKDAVGIHG
jgi:hypothetical protein